MRRFAKSCFCPSFHPPVCPWFSLVLAFLSLPFDYSYSSGLQSVPLPIYFFFHFAFLLFCRSLDLSLRSACSYSPVSSIKCLLSLLRYSGHDPDVLLNFSSEITSQCVHPYLNQRTESDLVMDLEQVFQNWFQLKKGEDIPDLCGHICMKLGRCDKAIKFLRVNLPLYQRDAKFEGCSTIFYNLRQKYKVFQGVGNDCQVAVTH